MGLRRECRFVNRHYLQIRAAKASFRENSRLKNYYIRYFPDTNFECDYLNEIVLQ